MKNYKQPSKKSETVQSKAAKQAPVDAILNDYKGNTQLKAADEEELLQGKFKTTQLKGAEEEELLQGKFETTQLKGAEEEEILQGKFETAQLQGGKEEELLQGKFETAQLKSAEEDELLQGKFNTAQLQAEEEEPLQKKENNTGLPDNLKSGVENLSGYAMDDVKVHYNSDKPAELQAHAYAQGSDIHVAPGQEKHLPHEAWHVAQQKQGRVQPTMQMKGRVNVNDDAGLETEADVMGAKAMNHNTVQTVQKQSVFSGVKDSDEGVTQRVVDVNGENDPNILWANVKGLVEKVYRRRKTLFEWAAEDRIYVANDYEELAEELDKANQSKASLGRVRPDWTPKIKKHFSDTWGGKRHRRHIIMSSLMRDAVYAVSDNTKIDDREKIIKYNQILSMVGFSAGGTLQQAESNLVYVLHNNPANLVLDSGPENSAIGSLAHNFNEILKKDDEGLNIHFLNFKKNPGEFFDSVVHGFQPGVQAGIIDIIKTFPLPENLADFRDFIEMLYDNMAVDLLTKVKLPSQAPALLNLHIGFVNAQDGNLETLFEVASKFVHVGLQNKPSYSEVW